MRFGVISTADIGLEAVIPAIRGTDHEVLAIASRDGDRARTVAEERGIPRAYERYEALLEDDDVEAVYNPLPNALHAEWTRRAADFGKDVLCEKPIATDAEEARGVFEHARERGVTVMEAFMYRFHPLTERAVDIARDELEDVHAVTSEFSFDLGNRTEDIRLDPELAGGSLMDVGCYAVNVARLFLGEPGQVMASTVDRRSSGVDTGMAGVLSYEDGSLARVASGFDTPLTQYYRVQASNGWLAVNPAFDLPADRTLEIEYQVDGTKRTESIDPVDHYRLEVEHFVEVASGEARPRVDETESVSTMRIIDALYRSHATGQPVWLSH
ncbi:MAG: Gfo/Idh/MocA family protein [Halodesulfurarchaeum sp.]